MRFVLPTSAFLARSSSAVLPAFLSFLSYQLPSRRLHFLAGVINDLTDTVNERCRKSVKQVVIKASPFAVRQGEKRKKERREERIVQRKEGIERNRRNKLKSREK